MRVLGVYAHPASWSFNHAILKSFTKGLRDGEHTYEVVDLYSIKFDPIVCANDLWSCISEDLPEWLLENLDLRKLVIHGCKGPTQRFLVKRWMRNKSLKEIARGYSRVKKSKEVLEQQAEVTKSDAIVFFSPVWWNNFPTILQWWVERVFSYGFAYLLNEAGWKAEVEGRIALLKFKKALIINTLFFKEEAYERIGLKEAMTKSIDVWGLKYPGIPEVEHVYFSAIYAVDDETRKGYLEKAYRLGKEF